MMAAMTAMVATTPTTAAKEPMMVATMLTTEVTSRVSQSFQTQQSNSKESGPTHTSMKMSHQEQCTKLIAPLTTLKGN